MGEKIVWSEPVPASEAWSITGRPFSIDGTDYLSTTGLHTSTSRLCVRKAPALVDATAALLREHQGGNIVELGICQGGSTALIAQLARPHKLVAIELDPAPVPTLERFVDEHGLRDVVRPHFGVDQADRSRLRQIMDEELGDAPLDLVIDDASHLLEPTRISFEVLFPRLREGGLYVIEDWNWEHLMAESLCREVLDPESPVRPEFEALLREVLDDPAIGDGRSFDEWLAAFEREPERAALPPNARTPLSILIFELVLVRAWSGEVISEINVSDLWVTARRGRAALNPDDFRLRDAVRDRFNLLPPTAGR